MIRLPGGKAVKNPRFKDRRTRRACPLCGKAVYDSSLVCPHCGGRRRADTPREIRQQRERSKGYPQPLYGKPEPVQHERSGGYPTPMSQERPYGGYPSAPQRCSYKTCVLDKGHEGRHSLRKLGVPHG